jgi:hypothetical protein
LKKICEWKRLGRTEKNWTIARGSEIKRNLGLWRFAQISPAEFETKWFVSVQILGESSSNGLGSRTAAGRTGNLSSFSQWRQAAGTHRFSGRKAYWHS